MFWHPVTGALLAWEPTAYSALALGAAAVSVLVAARIWEHRNERGSVLFIGLLLAAAGWAGSYGVQIGFSTRHRSVSSSRGLVGIVFFRFDLLVRAPVARRHVLEQTGDGLLVFDTGDNGNVVTVRLPAAD
jgi:hypothetical protein